MAKYNVTYTCGHEGIVNIIGPGREREWKLKCEESKLCPDCWQKQREEEKAKLYSEAISAKKELQLSDLTGSEAQIKWAESIRFSLIRDREKWIKNYIDRMRAYMIDGLTQKQINEAFDSIILRKTSASWWIDNRGMGYETLKAEWEYLQQEKQKPPAEIQETINNEATVYPEKAVSNLVAEITIKGDTIEIHYPERNEDFRVLVKKLGYKWESGWTRKITERTGSAIDRAAEAGNKILAAGFPIRIYDENIRQKAISGEYEPECRRWVQVRQKDQYKGWLAINWDGHDDDLYRAAKKIAGARWSNPSMVVPPENYLEVLDFAEMYKFNISTKAIEVIENAKALREASLTTGVKVPKSERLPEPGKVPEKLEVPQEVDIDDEFRDEN